MGTDFMLDRVAVIGSGSWGTAVTSLLATRARHTILWCHEQIVSDSINASRRNPHQLTFFDLPNNVEATTSLADAVTAVDAVLLVVPSAFLRSVCKNLAEHLDTNVPVLVLTKGVERGTGALMADVAAQELGNERRIAVLSGPNHAEEVCLGKISGAVIASRDESVARLFQQLLVCSSFRVYVSEDVCGIELCAAQKNVIAIACGMALALGAGDNTIAALMTRGLAEMSRVSVAMGGDPITCMGLAGMGDLVATCTSPHSRNRTFGEAFAHGESLDEYQRRTEMVVEGAEAAASICELAGRHNIQVPITQAVHGLLTGKYDLATAIELLLERKPNEEFYGVVPGAHGGVANEGQE